MTAMQQPPPVQPKLTDHQDGTWTSPVDQPAYKTPEDFRKAFQEALIPGIASKVPVGAS
jgi:hypothetical protein